MKKKMNNSKINKEINRIFSEAKFEKNSLNHSLVEDYNNILPKRYRVNNNIISTGNPQKLNIKKSQKILESINNKMNLLSHDQLNYIDKIGKNKLLSNNASKDKNKLEKIKSLNKLNLKSELFRDIFVKPKEEYLEKVKQTTEKIIYNELHPQEKIIKEYQEKELKKFKNEEEEKPDELIEMIKDINKKTDYYEVYNKSLLKKISNKNLKSNNTVLAELKNMKNKNIYNSISIINKDSNLEDEDDSEYYKNEKFIFNQQIQVDSPDIFNIKNHNYINPGIGYAPSIPIFMGDKPKLYELWIRVNSGIKEGEIQKEAHLYFYLGLTLENKNKFKKSNFYYKKYFKCAKNLEDKIGMGFSLNRIAVNYGKLKKYEKSLEYNLKNKKISDFENSFAGFYNLGICYRYLNNIKESNNNFYEALNWSKIKNDLDTKCLVYGQLGLNFEKLKDIKNSTNYFEKCKEISNKIGNFKLNLDTLICLSKLKGKFKNKKNEAQEYFSKALTYAHDLKDQKNKNLCKINIGILKGNNNFVDFKGRFDIKKN